MSTKRYIVMTIPSVQCANMAYSICGDTASVLPTDVSHSRRSRLDVLTRQLSLPDPSVGSCSHFANIQNGVVRSCYLGPSPSIMQFVPCKVPVRRWVDISVPAERIPERFGHLSSWQNVFRDKKTDTCHLDFKVIPSISNSTGLDSYTSRSIFCCSFQKSS